MAVKQFTFPRKIKHQQNCTICEYWITSLFSRAVLCVNVHIDIGLYSSSPYSLTSAETFIGKASGPNWRTEPNSTPAKSND